MSDTICNKCEQELHEGSRVYFEGKDYHEDCFNKKDKENDRDDDYFTSRGGLYR